MSSHPVRLQTVGGNTSGTLYGTGLSHSGGDTGTNAASNKTSGTWTFTVPTNAPDSLYYQCQYHSNMNGRFNIVNLAFYNGSTDLSCNNLTVFGDISANDASFNVLEADKIKAFRMDGHIIPTTNEIYDLGSAEYKIRHLFLSDNSLWIGDDHKIDISGGKMKFKKRKKDGVPQSIIDAGGDAEGATAHAGVTLLSEMTLHHWKQYALTKNVKNRGVGNARIEDIFGPNQTDFDVDRDSSSIEEATSTPSNGDKGRKGEMRFTASHLYICISGTGNNDSTWKKVELTAL